MVKNALRALAARNARLNGRLARPGDDEGSIMLALLLVFLGTSLAAIMTPVLLIAINGTRTDQSRVAQASAAEAGIDVGMAQIRAATDSSGNGVLSKLPCGTLTGSVSASSNPQYSVKISYYSVDPRGHTDGTTANNTWLATNAIKCIAGGGAYSSPSYGLLQSTGSDVATGTFTTTNSRTIQATYLFQSTNANISGGLIHIYKATSTDLCLDAGSSSPTIGTNVTMQVCSTGSAQQSWAYNNNLTISLVSSVGSNPPLGLCLDGGTPETNGLIVKLQVCSTTTLPQQQWSFNDSANFQGTTDGATANGPCFDVQTVNTPGSLVVLGACGGGATTQYDNIKDWAPDAAVGAGAAGASSGQLVNFNQFGRCLDVTNQTVSSAYLISWPCKQAPVASNVAWNQRWVVPTVAANATTATGVITTNPSSTLYCLQSPLNTTGYVVVVSTGCPQTGTGTGPLNMTWTVYGKTTSYSTSYQITDSAGYCLQPEDPTTMASDLFLGYISKIMVATCNGSTLQKWNAPANLLSPTPLKDIGEQH